MRTRRTVNGALMDLKSAAEFLGGSERWLRRLLETGSVPHRKLNRNIYFLRSELEAFVEDLEGVTLRQARYNAKRKKTAPGR